MPVVLFFIIVLNALGMALCTGRVHLGMPQSLLSSVLGLSFVLTCIACYRAHVLAHSHRRLESEVINQRQQLGEKNVQLSRVRQLSEVMISQVDLKACLDLAIEIVVDGIGAKRASIMLLESGGDEMRIVASRGLPEDVVRDTRVKVGQGIAGTVAKDGTAAVIQSGSVDPRFAGLVKRQKEIRSAIIAPIKYRNDVCGVLNVSDKTNGEAWSQEDVSVMSTLAGHIAMAIQKMDLYESLEEQVKKLEQALAELRKTQAELVQSEKLASIGQIAGGVAHEINNPLLVILGRAEYAMDKLPEDSPAMKDLNVIHAQTERIAEIVKNLLSFSRTSKIGESKQININQVIESTLSFTENQMRKAKIEVVRDLGEVTPVWGNQGQVQQVFVNIVINALQAMSKTGGKLTIRTRSEVGRVLASFEDTGPGIAPEDIDAIFEPFFTTKDEMEGTGLGLAISQGIIHAHGGKIEVGGSVGQGAVFTVELPVTDVNVEVEGSTYGSKNDHDSGRREGDSGAFQRCA